MSNQKEKKKNQQKSNETNKQMKGKEIRIESKRPYKDFY